MQLKNILLIWTIVHGSFTPIFAITMKKELPKELYEYELPEPDPLPEDLSEASIHPSMEEEDTTLPIASEPEQRQSQFDEEEILQLEGRLKILKDRRDSVERLKMIDAERSEKKDRYDVDYGLERDRLGYPVDRSLMITADRYIPCITENSINSELPGRVIVVVERHVFSPQGRKIILPKGSRMVCGYDRTKSGQTRLGLKCYRMITPKGEQLLMSGMKASDVMGRSGIGAHVDERFMEQYGASLLVAGIDSGFNLGKSWLSKHGYLSLLNNSSLNIDQKEGAFTSIIQKMLEKNGKLEPIIMVPSGTRILMVPEQDIVMHNEEEEILDDE